jgi:hypothetical protein
VTIWILTGIQKTEDYPASPSSLSNDRENLDAAFWYLT